MIEVEQRVGYCFAVTAPVSVKRSNPDRRIDVRATD
jgi:hypothetical protein